jgi:hypothetical protein
MMKHVNRAGLDRLSKQTIGSRDGDARNIITQARVNKYLYEWDEGNYEDENTEMCASCLTYPVCKTIVPKGFKLLHDQ